MAGFGFELVMAMPWTEAVAFAAAVGRARKMDLLDAAVAARLGQATEESWRKAVRELS